MTVKPTLKLAAVLTATTLAMTGLSACSSSDEEAPAKETTAVSSAAADKSSEAPKDEKKKDTPKLEKGRGPITFAMGKNDTDKLKPVIKAWNEKHPGEEVTLKELAGEADAQHDTLVQSLQNKGTDYDVMALDVIWTAEFAAHQWIAPLEGDLKVDTSKLLGSTVKSATYGGKLYAIPQNTNGQLLFRNTELAPDAPKTFSDLATECKDKVAPAGKDCLITQLKQYEGLTVNTAGFIEGWGGHVVGTDGKTPEVDQQPAKDGLKALVDAYTDGTISKDATAATEEQTHLKFIAGDTAFAINWPYMYDMANKNENSKVGGKFEVQPLVGKDGVGVSTLGGYNNAVNAFSKNKLTARDFAVFITDEANQKAFMEESFPPVLASVYDDADLIKKYPYLPALKVSLENAVPRPVSPFYPAISKAIQDNAYAALTGDKSVDDAAADMKAAIEQAAK